MDSALPATGTAELLQLLSPFIPDDFINDLLPPHRGRGRRSRLSSAQLYRLHLLSVLTPAHAFNQLTRLLAEQRAWRQFAHLSNRQQAPDVWMLHQFRQRCGAGALRRINQYLLEPMLPPSPAGFLSVGLIDATDLPAACHGHKKKRRRNTPPARPRWAGAVSSAARAASISAIRSTRCACG